MPTKAYMPRTTGPAFEDAVRRSLDGTVAFVTGDPVPETGDWDVLVAGRPTARELDASPRMSRLVIPYAGLPPGTADLLRARPRVAVHNLHHNAPATAEMALALLLAAARRIVPADRALRSGDWRPRYEDEQGVRLAGRTALVVGLGAVGARVARALLALDARVLAVRRRPGIGSEPPGVEVHDPRALDALLPRAEVLVLCAPSTPATRGLFDASRLGLLPQGAVLVNVARGDLVDEKALYEALRARRVGAAGLDVWWRYPEGEAARASTPPSAFPFGDLDSVVLSPHRGGHGLETEAERAADLADLLNAIARGGPVPHRVDLEAGY